MTKDMLRGTRDLRAEMLVEHRLLNGAIVMAARNLARQSIPPLPQHDEITK
jgi:hypothetical protein